MINPNPVTWLIAGFLTGYVALFLEARKHALQIPDAKTYWRMNFANKYFMYPFFYGAVGSLVFYLVTTIFPERFQKYWIVGIIMGILVATFQNMGGYAKQVHGVSTPFIYIWNIIVFFLFYYFVIKFLLRRL